MELVREKSKPKKKRREKIVQHSDNTEAEHSCYSEPTCENVGDEKVVEELCNAACETVLSAEPNSNQHQTSHGILEHGGEAYETANIGTSVETKKEETSTVESDNVTEYDNKQERTESNSITFTSIPECSVTETNLENSFSKLLDLSKATLKEITASEIADIPVVEGEVTTLRKESQILENNTLVHSQKTEYKTEIIPYTEEQLSALYKNTELEILDDFTSQYVEAELKGVVIKQHPLYDLLLNYLKVREKITGNNLELNQVRKEYEESRNSLWTLEKSVNTGTAECQDGVRVTARHVYDKATFHRTVFQTVIRLLGNILKLVNENHVLFSYKAEDLRLQIELYLQTTISNCINVTQLSPMASVSLTLQNEPAHLKPYLTEIRLCISVLFTFQRYLIRDSQFIKETREWLGRLIAVLLRLANYQDHLFILNHILRCPAGIANWASCYVQTPVLLSGALESPFGNYQVNHVITTLALMLSPIQKREFFLESLSQNAETAVDALWVMVDSEGEEDEESGTSLRENDLVSLLNQLRVADVFRLTLLIEHKNGQDYYDISRVTEHHVLKFFAFATVFIKILHKGLKTYQQPRYNQFSKRLCRMIRHVVQYATDQWEQFRKSSTLDKAMLQRLEVEYDAFFLRATYYLYSSQKLDAWQFLAVIPYHVASNSALWKLFYFLHDCQNAANSLLDHSVKEDYKSNLWKTATRNQFEEMLAGLSEAESYYLLNTFANMALAREKEDMDFIECATMDLLQVGFISEATQENCSKSSRILLTHITSKHPHLLSDILRIIKENMVKVSSSALYLYEELPLAIWVPTQNDMKAISSLLLNHTAQEDESRLARMILSRLNWDFARPGELFLPYAVHCQTAILVAEAAEKEPAYLPWAWQTILRLRLHINDKGFSDFGSVREIDEYSVINRGIREQQPFASFLSVLLTTWGHAIPLVCTRGLLQLQFLETHQKHEAVLFALNLIVPLFLYSQELIINHEKFQDILTRLISADRTYVSMAKNLIAVQKTVLEQFGNMIENQVVNYGWYGLDSPKLLVRLWINSLVSVPSWSRDYGILYLLDTIIRSAFFHVDAYAAVVDIFSELLKCTTPREQTSTISSLFKWVSQTNQSENLIDSSTSKYNWLAYVTINLEFEEKERKTGLWREVLNQLTIQKGKTNVDAAIKKAASVVKVPWFTSGNLCIYRWAQQAMDSSLDDPLLPLLWQKFFSLYLTRLPQTTISDKGSVGDKFFEGLVNFSFLKRMKRRLQETIALYKKKVEEEETEAQSVNKECLKLFSAYALWLEEPKLLEGNLHLPSLPAQYESRLLALIFQSNDAPWLEYLDYDGIKADQQHNIKLWRMSNYRERTNVNMPLPNPGKGMESADPVERIIRRLASYDAPKGPPEIKNCAPVVPSISFSDKDSMFTSLESCFRVLQQFAHDHSLRVSHHKSLNSTYKDLVPQLYRCIINRVTQKVPCKNKNAVLCTGPAKITIEAQEARINERILHQLESNRSDYEALLGKSLQAPAHSLCTASVMLQQTVRILQAQLHCNPATAHMGVELFYHILSLMNEENCAFLPTRTLFALCLERLGQSHIEGKENQMTPLLNKILQEPSLAEYLVPHFTPNHVDTPILLEMYSTIVRNATCLKCGIHFALLSKFDIQNWLILKKPKLFQRSEFLEATMKALVVWGFEPPAEAIIVHDVYRRFLLQIFEFQFPEHYGEVLVALLKASSGTAESGCVSLNVWLDILNSISRPVQIKLNEPVREQLRQYAPHQRMLQHQELLDTTVLLAQHFTQERLQYGLYGLYPKCRNYTEVFSLLIGMTCHALIVSAVNMHPGSLSDKLCEIIWPYLRDVFAPWVVPYSLQNMRENMASWIQQLSDDRSVLLPWIPADGPHAQKMVNMLFECVQFITHTLPGCSSILSHIWQWYVVSFAHKTVKDHIVNPVHAVFLGLPWDNFWPNIADLDMMLKVVEQNLPDCHVFLGHIFISVQWQTWMCNINDNVPIQIRTRIHHCLLYLLTKLANEPYVRTNYAEKMKSLLIQAENFNWNLIEPITYQQIMDWYVLSCDSQVLFKCDPLDLDVRVLNFLGVVSGYHKPPVDLSTDLLQKRHIFVRSYLKLLAVYTSRHKASIQSKENEIMFVINSQLNHMEAVVHEQDEMEIILGEMLCSLNFTSINNVAEKCFSTWMSSRMGDEMVIKILLKVLTRNVTDCDIVGKILENMVSTYFFNRGPSSIEPSWQEMAELMVLYPPKLTELEQVLISKGYILTLNTFLLQRITRSKDTANVLNMCMVWLPKIKISEAIEPKLPILWSSVLTLCLKNCGEDETGTAINLKKFAHLLIQYSGDKGATGWSRGLLGAIGLNKQPQPTLNFRFLCRALAGYILAQLPDMKGQSQVVRQVANAPCAVGQPGGNTECVKVLLDLDFGQSQGKIKDCAELALKQIQDPANSLHNVKTFLSNLLKHLDFVKPYLKDVG